MSVKELRELEAASEMAWCPPSEVDPMMLAGEGVEEVAG